MDTDCRYLVEKAGIDLPILGLYDTPDPSAFEPLVRPVEGRWACVYMFYQHWLKGESLHLTKENYGCGGAGTYMLGVETQSRKDAINFLYAEEGLKASGELMGQWIDQIPTYKPTYGNIIIGPFKDHLYDYLKTVTFFINPDQLSLFVTGAYYHQGPTDPPLVTAPFASGCGLLGPIFADMDVPQAMIGATDIAMRKFLPPDILGFTVTKPMYEQLCSLDERSFLDKPFWRDVVAARKRS
jgi:hypothetical protein